MALFDPISASMKMFAGGTPRTPRASGETTPTDPTTTTDPFGGLEGADRDAYVAITNLLKTYGLESLAASVLGFIQQGYSSDTITVLLQNTDAYKQRFAANEVRRQKGLPVLSPAEYLATEQAYRQVMSAAGLPPGYYDQTDDFKTLLGNDVSPTEVQQRVRVASDLINNIDPNVRAAWGQWYTTGDMVAYALDPERAATVLERQYTAASAAAYGREQGVSISQQTAELIGASGVNDSSLRQGMGVVSSLAQSGQKLSSIYGGSYSEDDAAREVFTGDSVAGQKRRKLASQERATFGGNSGLTDKSLSRQTSGRL